MYMGYGSQGNGAYGQWGHRGQWGIGYIGNEMTRGKVVQGVWVQGVWGTWPIRPTGGMGYCGYGAHGQ